MYKSYQFFSKTISKVIIDFAEGEVQQGSNYFNYNIYVQNYMEKSFYKTASLIAASCKSAYLLNLDNIHDSNNAYNYGKYLGLAFQMIDDILDIIGSEALLGKPTGLDLKNGNLTAPILFAIVEEPYLITLIEREFSQVGDFELALHLIKRSSGIQQAKDMAFEYIQSALTCLRKLGVSNAILSLKQLTHYIFTRLN